MSAWMDAPRLSGYYWVRWGPARRVELVRVEVRSSRVEVWSMGTEEESPLTAWPGAEWCGPLVPPA